MAEARFGSAAEEAQHYKAQVKHMQDALREAETGLQEFMESSKELEAELEADIAQSTERANALQAENETLRCDVDEWRGKYQQSLAEHNATLGDLHRELSKLRESHDVYKTKLRDMELDNDELENAERMINSSLADMEGRYNTAMERTALLESELEDKTRLEEENQRLKDELRDLREELAVRHASPLTRAAEPERTPQSDRAVGEVPAAAEGPAASATEPSANGAHDTDHDDDELQLSDLVTTKRAPKPYTLDRLRDQMQQLQLRLQTAQTATFATRPNAERSALPRPRSSLSASQSASPWRSQTPLGRAQTPLGRTHTPLGRAETPHGSRPETPTSVRAERRKSHSSIPVPTNGLSRSASRLRPPSRMHDGSPSSAVPYEFMEHDPSESPPRRASVMRRRSGHAPSGLPRARAASPSKLRTSPTKPPVPWK